MYSVPADTRRYFRLDKTTNTFAYIGDIADVKTYITIYGTASLSMNLRLETKTKIVATPVSYDSERCRFITKDIPNTYIIRPYVIFDDKYRILNYTNLELMRVSAETKCRKTKSGNWTRICGKMCWTGGINTGSKRHYRGKNHYHMPVSLREKRLTESFDIDFDDINESFKTNSAVIEHALRHSRIRNRWINNDEHHHTAPYGTPESWKKQHKRKQWQKKHDTRRFDKHAHIYEINASFIEQKG